MVFQHSGAQDFDLGGGLKVDMILKTDFYAVAVDSFALPHNSHAETGALDFAKSCASLGGNSQSHLYGMAQRPAGWPVAVTLTDIATPARFGVVFARSTRRFHHARYTHEVGTNLSFSI